MMQNEIELVIRIPEVDYKHFKELYELLPKDTIFVDTVAYYIGNGTPLNGTNGDVLKAIYKDVKTIQYKGWVDVEINHNHFSVSEDWWNASYNTGSEEV